METRCDAGVAVKRDWVSGDFESGLNRWVEDGGEEVERWKGGTEVREERRKERF